MIAKYINKVSFTFLVFHVSTTLDRWLIKYERIMKFRDKKKNVLHSHGRFLKRVAM